MISDLVAGAPLPFRLSPSIVAAPITFSFFPIHPAVDSTRIPASTARLFTARPAAAHRRLVAAAEVEAASNPDFGEPRRAGSDRGRRVFFLDVNPLCYEGSRPSLHSFARWIDLFFSRVSVHDPVVAVLDGEGGNEYRRRLLPSYKAHRRRLPSGLRGRSVQYMELVVTDVLRKCNVPVVKVSGYEADDVIATLTDQVLEREMKVVIGSPDKDFKQLICDDVQIVMPMPEFGRWSFYTLKHYMTQYNCDPSSDLSLRCILGDEVDGVPGIQHLAPGFGRKTAVKLLKRHSSLENLLNAAAIRTVGKDYAQDALTRHAHYLRKNYEVLSLRRDADVHLEEAWLFERDSSNDSVILSDFVKKLNDGQKHRERYLHTR